MIRLLKIGRRETRIDGRNQPDWGYVHTELKKKGVTLQLLWEEYKVSVPDGYQLSQFYGINSQWKRKLNVVLRQTHKAGEKLFVDYAGQTVPVVDRHTGEIMDAQIFVAVLLYRSTKLPRLCSEIKLSHLQHVIRINVMPR